MRGIALVLVLVSPPGDPLPAFPGAEGFGANTPGGRGGKVIAVTTLDASGPGSLDAACRASGPRIVVFRVGGTIRLKRNLEIREPFITIAGQTAPGDGICMRGAGLSIRTHDVVVRYLRVRVGDDPVGPNPENRDGIEIAHNRPGEVHDIVVDHCSVSWAIDENVSTWYECRDVTFQWCLVGEALMKSRHPKGGHSMGILVGDHAKRVSVHHCLMAHNNGRNPLMKGDTEAEVVNNVVWNYGYEATAFSDPEGSGAYRANVIGNTYLPGAQSRNRPGIRINHPKDGTRIFVRGNLGPGRESDAADDWKAVAGDGKLRSLEPVFKPSGISVQPAVVARELVLRYAGAVLPKRDAVDERIVRSVREGKGKVIDSQDEAGGWPEYAGGAAPADSDGDGIPDAWEAKRGLNPANPRDGAAVTRSGYTCVEEYLNSLVPATSR